VLLLYPASIFFTFLYFYFIISSIKVKDKAQAIFLPHTRGYRYSCSQGISSFYSCVVLVHFNNNFHVFLTDIVSLHVSKYSDEFCQRSTKHRKSGLLNSIAFSISYFKIYIVVNQLCWKSCCFSYMLDLFIFPDFCKHFQDGAEQNT